MAKRVIAHIDLHGNPAIYWFPYMSMYVMPYSGTQGTYNTRRTGLDYIMLKFKNSALQSGS